MPVVPVSIDAMDDVDERAVPILDHCDHSVTTRDGCWPPRSRQDQRMEILDRANG